jgi:hypothetical protein
VSDTSARSTVPDPYSCTGVWYIDRNSSE